MLLTTALLASSPGAALHASASGALRRVAGEVPVAPDAPTARELLRQELTNPVYHQGPSLLDRFLAWVQDLFAGLGVAGVSGPWVAVILVAVVVAVAAVALAVSGPLRRDRRTTGRGQGSVLALDDLRTADQLLAAATDAAARGDLASATLDTFRALVRRSEERALLDSPPGQTAHEAALALSLRLPDHRGALAAAASTFDAVCYGRAQADRTTYETLRALESAVAAARPASLAPATVRA